MKPEQAARTLAMIGTLLLILAALVRLLAAYILTYDTRFLPGASLTVTDRSPLMGLYTLSPDRNQVGFSRGVTIPTGDQEKELWVGNTYSLDLDSGAVQSGVAEREQDRFVIRDSQLQIQDDRMEKLLADRKMEIFAVSGDGQNLAFAEVDGAAENWTLYAVRAGEQTASTTSGGAGEIYRLTQQSYFADLSWSPDSLQVFFVAPVRAGSEIFRYDFQTGLLEQLTSDGRLKREPVASVDGTRIAYLASPEKLDINTVGRATPTPLLLPPRPAAAPSLPGVEIYLLDMQSGSTTRLTDNSMAEFSLGWTAGGQILFSVWQSDWPMVAWLYALDPDAKAARRAYPFVAIERLSCAPDWLGANKATVRLTVSNSSSQIQNFPVEISMDRAPLDVVTTRSQRRMQRESIELNPGESRELEYSVTIVNDQKAFLSATIETGSEFPLDAAFCAVEPRTLLLPRLRWFGATLGLVFVGYLLSVPWLRHQKNAWLWRAWSLFLVFLAILVGVESAAILGWLGG